MITASMPMPGALRWRALHPLIDEDGTCSLLYDLERAAVLEVPEELQLHVAPALETGDPDDELLSWLVREDLITMEGWAGWAPDMSESATPLMDWGPGAVLRLDGEAHVRVTQATEEAIFREMAVGFRQGLGAPRVQLHLDWDGAFPGTGTLERIVREALLLAIEAGQEVEFDLTLRAAEVTPAVALFLSAMPVHVRLLCDEFPGDEGSLPRDIRRALMLLWVQDLPDRVTVCFDLPASIRLKELWSWARRLGVRHLDAVRRPYSQGAQGAGAQAQESRAAWIQNLKCDLQDVVQEVCACLEDGSVPIDFRPLARVIRRLMHAEPLSRFRPDPMGGWRVGDAGSVGDTGGGFESDGPAKDWLGAAADSEESSSTSCTGCWARLLCRNSALQIHGAPVEERTVDACDTWRMEADAALRLYHRLAHADPLQVLRVFGESSGLPDDLPSSRMADPWGLGSKAPC